MKSACKQLIGSLVNKGWNVRFRSKPKRIPAAIMRRYHWLPPDVRAFLSEVAEAVTSDEKAWFNTSSELSAESELAFSWDEWERLSLNAAEDDSDWRQRISEFWDSNFPLLMSVKNFYGYFAIRREGLTVVEGNEPDFEETTHVADSFLELLKMIVSEDPKLSLWI